MFDFLNHQTFFQPKKKLTTTVYANYFLLTDFLFQDNLNASSFRKLTKHFLCVNK